MLTQRWRNRRDCYRPAGEVIEPRRYEVAAVPGDAVAREFVQTHHYSGSYPAARFRFGLYEGAALAGVAVFSVPASARVLAGVFPGDPLASVELGRFVLLDRVPGNGETWFLARCFDALRQGGIEGVVSFSDPVPRSTAAGRVIFPGHLGVIYQAHNAAYLGRATARTLRILPDGTVLSDRALSKIRAGERGWRYAAAILAAHGADAAPDSAPARRDWLASWLPKLTRGVRHPGNHRYAWALAGGAVQRRLKRTGQPYPKRGPAAGPDLFGGVE